MAYITVESAVGAAPPDARSEPRSISPQHSQNNDYYEHYLARSGRKIQIFELATEVDTGSKLEKAKTIGTITVKNGTRVLKVAHSGYTSKVQDQDTSLCLDTDKYNTLALFHVAREIEFEFPKNHRDTAGAGPVLEEFAGRAHAGHVEVLLASWYVLHLLRTELGFPPGCSDESLVKHLGRLKKLPLGDKATAYITLDKNPCGTCMNFLLELWRYTNVNFLLPKPFELGPINGQVDPKPVEDVSNKALNESLPELLAAQSNPSKPLRQKKLVHAPWTDNGQLVLSYKKKTPVEKFPGYTPCPSPEGEEDVSAYWKDSPSCRPRNPQRQETPSIEKPAEPKSNWENVGDDILMLDSGITQHTTAEFSVKHERQSPLPSTGQTSTASNRSTDGELFAQSAYKATHKIVKSVEEDDDYDMIESEHAPIRRAVHSSKNNYSARLQRFKHQGTDDEDESVFRGRFAILGPRTTP